MSKIRGKLLPKIPVVTNSPFELASMPCPRRILDTLVEEDIAAQIFQVSGFEAKSLPLTVKDLAKNGFNAFL